MQKIDFKKVGEVDFETKCVGCEETMLITVGDRIHFRDGEPIEIDDGVFVAMPDGFLCVPCNKRENPDLPTRTALFQWIGCMKCGKTFDAQNPSQFIPVMDDQGNPSQFLCEDCHDE